MFSTNMIEKTIHVAAPQRRVFRALADSEQFGAWFRCKLDGEFEAGKSIRGKLLHEKYAHLTIEFLVVAIEPEHYFAFRWHPYALDEHVDYSTEPTTLVEFRLQESKNGTEVTVVESGFDQIPAERRDIAFRMNSEGWAAQVENIRRYVTQ